MGDEHARAPAGTLERRPKALIAILLAVTAGCADTLFFLALAHGFVSHMSGDTEHAAIALARGEWSSGLLRLLPVPGFVLGAVLGRTLADAMRAAGRRHRMAWLLVLEAVLLTAAWGVRSAWPLSAVPIAAAAMGLQSAALRHVAGHKLRTTFITGMLVAFADEAVAAWLQGKRERRAYFWLHAAVWFGFGAGAALGVLAWSGSLTIAAVILGGILASLIAWDVLTPIETA